jgi:hypothetical protein
MQTGFNWLGIGSNGGLFFTWWWILGSIIALNFLISWVTISFSNKTLYNVVSTIIMNREAIFFFIQKNFVKSKIVRLWNGYQFHLCVVTSAPPILRTISLWLIFILSSCLNLWLSRGFTIKILYSFIVFPIQLHTQPIIAPLIWLL